MDRDAFVLNKMALAVGSTLRRDELLRRLLAELNRFMPCEGLGFFWRDSGGYSLVAVVAPSDSTGGDAQEVSIESGPDHAEDGSEPFWSLDNRSSSHPVLRWLGEGGLASSLCVPVVVAQQPLGWLVASRAKANSFSVRELQPLLLVARLAGPALNGIRLQERLDVIRRDLAKARDELIRSERLMVQGEMASGVAHDINNILALIAARADLLSLQRLPSQALEAVEAIRQAVDDGVAVVRRMTEFARKQRSQELALLDVNGVVKDALEMTRPRWQSSRSSEGPRVRVRFEPGQVPRVMGVASELREVMVNLVMNALDATSPGGEVMIETLQEGAWAVICVADTGCGMSEDVRQHIFEPFFTTKGERGSGLGLWVSHSIVARHGGDIQVHSEEGRGSSFRVRLPSTSPVAMQAAPQAPRASHAILVVDDERGLCEALKLSLETVGYQVVVSADARRALDMFKASPFDLVITDLRMPGMSGWELAAEIKRLSPRTPIIAMTGWPVDLVQQGQRVSDVELIIQKPYRVNDVRAKVARVLAERSPTR